MVSTMFSDPENGRTLGRFTECRVSGIHKLNCRHANSQHYAHNLRDNILCNLKDVANIPHFMRPCHVLILCEILTKSNPNAGTHIFAKCRIWANFHYCKWPNI